MTAPNPSSPLSVSIIVPTYREAENIPDLVGRIESACEGGGFSPQLLIMDDASDDGTPAVVASLNKAWVTLTVRSGIRGLSPAVIDGLSAATSEYLVVMDADLSHPPEAIPELVRALADTPADFVIGSRYVKGGATDAAWGPYRWLNSRLATLMAWPFASVSDPMAGFFAIRRSTFLAADYLNPVGYKIGLELIVKCNCSRIAEVPILFSERVRGTSKLSLREQWNYIRHLKRLSDYKFGAVSQMAQFATVGIFGAAVNILSLTALRIAGVPLSAAVALAIGISLCCNFALNRLLTFAASREGSVLLQFGRFVLVCSGGALVNYLVAVLLIRSNPFFGRFPQIASCIGIVAGMGLNYVGSRLWAFSGRSTAAKLPVHQP